LAVKKKSERNMKNMLHWLGDFRKWVMAEAWFVMGSCDSDHGFQQKQKPPGRIRRPPGG
jgi:hypothetical protein